MKKTHPDKRVYSLFRNRQGGMSVRYSRLTDRHDREAEHAAVDRRLRSEVPFKQWKKRQIAQTFTDAYVADLITRARKNARTSLAELRRL